jgi:hypothetical protein
MDTPQVNPFYSCPHPSTSPAILAKAHSPLMKTLAQRGQACLRTHSMVSGGPGEDSTSCPAAVQVGKWTGRSDETPKLLPTSEPASDWACSEAGLGTGGDDQAQSGPVPSRPAAAGPTPGPTRAGRSWWPGQPNASARAPQTTPPPRTSHPHLPLRAGGSGRGAGQPWPQAAQIDSDLA